MLGFLGIFSLLSASAARAQASVDPCKLLTQAQVSEASGVSVGAGSPIYTTGCQLASSGKDVMPLRVSLSLEPVSTYETMLGSTPGVTTSSASGFGDGTRFATLGTSRP